MHTTIHAPWTKDHALIIGPKNQCVIIITATIQTKWQMLKPLYACKVAERTLTRPKIKKAWSPKIGGNDLELARWSSHLPVQNEKRTVVRTRSQPQCLLVSCTDGDSIPLMGTIIVKNLVTVRTEHSVMVYSIPILESRLGTRDKTCCWILVISSGSTYGYRGRIHCVNTGNCWHINKSENFNNADL